MSKFKKLFDKSNEEFILYKGKKIFLIDYLDLNKDDKLKIKVLSANTNRTQMFSVNIQKPENKKYLEVNGKNVKGIPFHKEIMPKEGVEVKILEDNVRIKVTNRGSSIFSWPMMVEQKEDKRIYYCNADDPEEKFDDLVFEIEIVKKKSSK